MWCYQSPEEWCNSRHSEVVLMYSEEGEGGDGSKAVDRTHASLGLISVTHTRMCIFMCEGSPGTLGSSRS